MWSFIKNIWSNVNNRTCSNVFPNIWTQNTNSEPIKNRTRSNLSCRNSTLLNYKNDSISNSFSYPPEGALAKFFLLSTKCFFIIMFYTTVYDIFGGIFSILLPILLFIYFLIVFITSWFNRLFCALINRIQYGFYRYLYGCGLWFLLRNLAFNMKGIKYDGLCIWEIKKK